MGKKTAHVSGVQRNAAGGRLVARADHVHEDGRAAIALPGSDIPVEHQTDIIEPVFPADVFVTWLEWRSDQPIVVRIAWRIAPQHRLHCAAQRQRRLHGAQAFAPDEAIKQRHLSDRRFAVTFPLENRASIATNRSLKR